MNPNGAVRCGAKRLTTRSVRPTDTAIYIDVRNDNNRGKVPGGVNIHTANGGFQPSLREHLMQIEKKIRSNRGMTRAEKDVELRKYYTSLGAPYEAN
jgi:hypothetical protein